MPAAVIVAGAVIQGALGRWVSSPWWSPDLLVICLLLALVAQPTRATVWIATAAATAAILAAGQPVLVASMYLACGALFRWIGARWNLADGSVQLAGVALAESLLASAWLIGAGAVTLDEAAGAVVRVLLTAAALPIVRALTRAVLRPSTS